MRRLRRVIALDPAERQTLINLYLVRRLPTDRYQHRPRELASITDTFNNLTGRSDAPYEVLHYMRTQRKNGRWPRLEGRHRRLPPLADRVLDEGLLPALVEVYERIGVGVDNFGHDGNLALRLERDFAEETGVRVRGYQLATVLMEIRKAGDLPTLVPRDDESEFVDFGAAEAM